MSKPSKNGENGDVYADPKEQLLSMHSMTDDGMMVTNLEHSGQHWRGMLLGILYTHPKSFNRVNDALHAAGGDLQKRRDAFVKAAGKVLRHCYEHPWCEQWRVIASRTVKAMDEEAFAQYKTVKYAGTEAPDRDQRIKAYDLVVAKFIALSYTVSTL